jgi:hypothetical protein
MVAYAITHVGGVLVEETLLPLVSTGQASGQVVGNPRLTGLWKGCPSLGNNVSFLIAAGTLRNHLRHSADCPKVLRTTSLWCSICFRVVGQLERISKRRVIRSER